MTQFPSPKIRLFGDPRVEGNEFPTQRIGLSLDINIPTLECVPEPSQNVICDFVDGFAFGDAIGVAFRCISGWWTITDINVKNSKARLDMSYTISSLNYLSVGNKPFITAKNILCPFADAVSATSDRAECTFYAPRATHRHRYGIRQLV